MSLSMGHVAALCLSGGLIATVAEGSQENQGEVTRPVRASRKLFCKKPRSE